MTLTLCSSCNKESLGARHFTCSTSPKRHVDDKRPCYPHFRGEKTVVQRRLIGTGLCGARERQSWALAPPRLSPGAPLQRYHVSRVLTTPFLLSGTQCGTAGAHAHADHPRWPAGYTAEPEAASRCASHPLGGLAESTAWHTLPTSSGCRGEHH